MNPVERLCIDAVSSIDISAGLHGGTRQGKGSVCLPTYYNRPADVTLAWRCEIYPSNSVLALVVIGASAVACVACVARVGCIAVAAIALAPLLMSTVVLQEK